MEVIRQRFALWQTWFFRWGADLFFKDKYDRRALVLETIAGVPGMVGGMLTHLKSLRRLERGNGTKIHELLAEAENERKHLMFMMEVVHPNVFERFMVYLIQFVFWHYYLLLYFLSPRTAHYLVHYFETQAVDSYTTYLELIGKGCIDNPPAPEIAIEYYDLRPDATVYDMIYRIREDERKHAQVNKTYAEEK